MKTIKPLLRKVGWSDELIDAMLSCTLKPLRTIQLDLNVKQTISTSELHVIDMSHSDFTK